MFSFAKSENGDSLFLPLEGDSRGFKRVAYPGNNPFICSPAFNVTIRSDRRGTCKGTHLVYACVGYCESSAFPSRYSVLVASNFTHNITSASRCCTIGRDAKVREARERLLGNGEGALLLDSSAPSFRSKFAWTAPGDATTTKSRSSRRRRAAVTCAANPATETKAAHQQLSSCFPVS